MRFGQIRQFGFDPGESQDQKYLRYDYSTDQIEYVEIIPGDSNVQSDWDETDINSDSYILNKPTIPDSLDDLSGDSDNISQGVVHLFLTTIERGKLTDIAEGAEVNVQSDWNVSDIDSDAYILNKPTIPTSLSALSGTLDDITEGTTNKQFTSTIKTNVTLNTTARHSHTNKLILDDITDAGSGSIITVAERQAIVDMVSGNPEVIRDTVADFIQDGIGVSWTHDDENNTLTPEVTLEPFTTDDLIEGTTNLYPSNVKVKPFQDILLPANSTVGGRIAGAVAGVDYPLDWVLSVGESEYDILITHNWGRKVFGVNVLSVDALGQERVLVPFNSAYSGWITPTDNSLLIETLSEKTTKLRIVIAFVPL